MDDDSFYLVSRGPGEMVEVKAVSGPEAMILEATLRRFPGTPEQDRRTAAFVRAMFTPAGIRAMEEMEEDDIVP